MTKICMVVHQAYHRDTRVRRYAEALVEKGCDVDVICVRDPNQPPGVDLAPVRVYTIPLIRLYGGVASYLLEYSAALVFYTLWLLVLHVRNRYDVIHVHNTPDFLAFAALLPRLLGTRLILDLHDPMPEFFLSKYDKPPDSRVARLLGLQEQLSARLAHAVITANVNFKDRVVARGADADHVTVVYNIPDGRIFNRAAYPAVQDGPREHFVLLYTGTYAPRYGLDIAIRALPELVAALPDVRLTLVGPRVAYTAELEALARQLGVADYVQFVPAVPVGEIPAWIRRADVGIYPALPDAHMDIAIPSKVVEFAFMGLPVIASRLQGVENLFGSGSLLYFEPGSAAGFARCVRELHASPAKRAALVQAADEAFVRHHSWQQEADVYFRLLNRMLPPGRQITLPVPGEDGQAAG